MGASFSALADAEPQPEPVTTTPAAADEPSTTKQTGAEEEVAPAPVVVVAEAEADATPAEAPAKEEEPAPPPPPPPPPRDLATMSKDDIEKAKAELVDEIATKMMADEDLVANEVVTAPYDPRFPSTNQSRHCFVRYNEYHKCLFERGQDDQRCAFYKRAADSLCPADWVEEWDTLRQEGKWFGKY